ncbi:hypothetical protein G7B40_031040 [Aetokthonos hydrillicola Thurmond2011]|jgi:hypothetical protein|uniref:Uncharacterized protein n=1 Tax=Aetokthonos hydrillicola Thurmond2011 TaxID=2712845 RepID=A0AAP5ICF5_9CYAN|nr:hypothetical protein [Aetokthonos hydrillicola]MBO3462113.1 hypothetical protein [Aetokthonos hydrillicola CCALA 1050]MBW4589707.1 hypothetical protein [Aetokthonos hydrillicola CCALA 1050]MDR9898961.1 hypothetical protein [Aetokthonos hydrillicola Thurmond2011]
MLKVIANLPIVVKRGDFMHVLHFIVINAESPQQACNDVDCFLQKNTDNFGYEYFTVIGCVSEDEHYVHDENGIKDISELNSISKLNDYCKQNFQMDKVFTEKAIQAMEKFRCGAEMTQDDWWNIRIFAGFMERTFGKDLERFDILQDTFLEYDFQSDGVTALSMIGEGVNKYVVFVEFAV